MKAPPAPAWVHLGLMATMVAWALNVTALKWLTGIMDVMLVASLRMVFTCLALLLLLALSRQSFPRWRPRMLVLALASAMLMVYGNQAVIASAMQKTTASNAALILALNPLLNGVLEALVFRKRMRASFLAGVALAVAGVAMVILNQPQASLAGPTAGDMLVFASMLCFSMGVLVLQRLSRDHDPLAINAFLYLVGTVALLVHAGVTVDAPLAAMAAFSWQAWAGVVCSGVLATALGAIAWTRGVAALGLGGASVYMSWVPVLGVGFGALLLGEKLTVWHLFGMILVLLGTVVSSRMFQRPAAPSTR